MSYENIPQTKNAVLSVQEFIQYRDSIFQFLSILQNYKQCCFPITKDMLTPAPLSDFERLKGPTVSERSLVLEGEQGC